MTSKLILARRFHFHSDLWKRSAKAATSAIQNSCREIYYRKDITGNLFSNSGSVTSSAKNVEKIDEMIMDIVTYNHSFQWDKIAINTDTCALEVLLEIFIDLRAGWRTSRIEALLFHLESLFTEGKLNAREQFLSAAALAWYEGRYMTAGAYLESSLMTDPQDALTMRLAQDCYLEAGSAENALGCVLRHQGALDSTFHLYGHSLGMLCAGYSETGRLSASSETGEKAMSRLRGKDCWALHSLLNCAQRDTNTSLILSYLSQHESTSILTVSFAGKSGTGLLLFNKGSALAMRGAYKSAYQTYAEVVRGVLEAKVAGQAVSRTQLESATLILWQLCLQSGERGAIVEGRENLVVLADILPAWREILAEGDSLPSWLVLCGSMYASLCREGLDNPEAIVQTMMLKDLEAALDKSRNLTSSSGGVSGDGEGRVRVPRWSFWNRVLGRDSPTSFPLPPPPLPDPSSSFEGGEENLSSILEELALLELRLSQLQQAAGSRLELGHAAKAATTLALPSLRGIRPKFKLSRSSSILAKEFSPAEGGPTRAAPVDAPWLLPARAIAAFAAGQYEKAAHLLEDLIQSDGLYRLGGTYAQRDILRCTYVEALLRSGHVDVVELMLRERVMLYPEDAQAWRRLASIYGKLGKQELAESANYSAWQFGIGQGGFGGPR